MLKLRIEGQKASEIWLVEPKVLIGSDSQASMVIRDESVAPQHCEIYAKGEKLAIKRLCDGQILINGRKLGQQYSLKINDRLTVGQTNLVVVDPKVDSASESAKTHEKAQSKVASVSEAQWHLVGKNGPLLGKAFPITDGITVGRSTECEVSLPEAHLSRRHAQFQVIGTKLRIVDLNSANGTFVNDQPIVTESISHGDEIRFDQLAFVIKGSKEDLDKTFVRPAIDDNMINAAMAASASAGVDATTRRSHSSMREDEFPVVENTQLTELSSKHTRLPLPLMLAGAVVAAGVVWWALM
ncbi:FHA domain-containing protein [Marinibactrum halimedae]|nr:FHA domain-containing protein [Marinibactrum halimedae]MCD9458500.1 FHA domain-containing protein [Marinibactrum halimedae]